MEDMYEMVLTPYLARELAHMLSIVFIKAYEDEQHEEEYEVCCNENREVCADILGLLRMQMMWQSMRFYGFRRARAQKLMYLLENTEHHVTRPRDFHEPTARTTTEWRSTLTW